MLVIKRPLNATPWLKLVTHIAIFVLLLWALFIGFPLRSDNQFSFFLGMITAIVVAVRIVSMSIRKTIELRITPTEIFFKKGDYSFSVDRSKIITLKHSLKSIRIIHESSFEDELLAKDFSPNEWEQIKWALPVIVPAESAARLSADGNATVPLH